MNYTSISSAVVRWLNREGMTNLTDEVELLIEFGQRRIQRTCDFHAMEEVCTLYIDAQDVEFPSDLDRVKNIHILQGTDSYEVVGAPTNTVLDYTTTDMPHTYAIVGDKLYFGPPPSQSYEARLVYFKKLPILSSTETTNWFSENAPELLIFATLVEACLFLKDDARAQVWEMRYQQVKSDIEKSEERADREGGSLRVRAK